MPVIIHCRKCDKILFNVERCNMLKAITDLVGTNCPACSAKLQMPDPDKLQIQPLGKPTRQTYQRKKVVSEAKP